MRGEEYVFLLLAVAGGTFGINRILWRNEKFELAKLVESVGTVAIGITILKIIYDTFELCLKM